MSTRETVARRLRAPKTVALVAATALSVLAAAATAQVLGSQLAFLVVVVLGVSVPTTLDSYGLLPDEYGRVVGAVVVAALVHWVVFLGVFVAVRPGATELVTTVVAFVVTVVASAVVGQSMQG